jgi:hypothetical protein
MNPANDKRLYSSLHGGGYDGCNNSVLDSNGAWCPEHSSVGNWMQIDLDYPKTISGIITQKRKYSDQWVTTY